LNNKSYILIVFEGEKTEKDIFNSLKQYFLNKNRKTIVYGFHCGEIYSLYNKLNKDENETLFFILKEKLQAKNPELLDIDREYIESIYLFFDYDNHATAASDDKLQSMLEFFNDEFENGKLYISYPMVEAIKHLKTGIDFQNVIVESKPSYKQLVSENCNYELKDLSNLTKENWNFIIKEHSKKANFIVNDSFELPDNIIEQINIFDNQKAKYIDVNNRVAVLSAFPLFLLDYYGIAKFDLMKNLGS
jgi:hypothetical protein